MGKNLLTSSFTCSLLAGNFSFLLHRPLFKALLKSCCGYVGVCGLAPQTHFGGASVPLTRCYGMGCFFRVSLGLSAWCWWEGPILRSTQCPWVLRGKQGVALEGGWAG